MRHFLDITQLTLLEANTLISRAQFFKKTSQYPSFRTSPMANLFYENSTRTRVSFELAARHLEMPVVNLDGQGSSESKGEVIQDTVNNLSAMGVKLFVIRHAEEGLPERIAGLCGERSAIVNAGDGTHAHPSQAMLDLMTIIEQKPDLSRLKIAIVGDIRHSRVANSFQHACALMGVGQLMLIAPTLWQPQSIHYGQFTDSLQEGLANADVVIGLRVQKERLKASEQMNLEHYHRAYGITQESLKTSKKEVMVMHPGPINRGIEMDSDVADGPHSYILQQVKNGVFMRMAILDWSLDQPRSNTSPPEPDQSDF
ncbi:MAG: aspartate carbamoyltransferase catalytic subunit [Legionellales bacterium]|nr:aspartate carbamoyltransferase catalytic subunit [Legionellales bacterium]